MCHSAPFVLKNHTKTTDTIPRDLLRDMRRLPQRKILRTYMAEKKIKYAVVYPMYCSLSVCLTVFETIKRKQANSSEMLRYEHIT